MKNELSIVRTYNQMEGKKGLSNIQTQSSRRRHMHKFEKGADKTSRGFEYCHEIFK